MYSGSSDRLKNLTAYITTSGQGSKTYEITSQTQGSTTVNKFSIVETSKLSMAAGTAVGAYTVKVKITAAGNDYYNSAAKTLTINLKNCNKKSSTYVGGNSSATVTFSSISGTLAQCITSNGATVSSCSKSGTTVTVKITGVTGTVANSRSTCQDANSSVTADDIVYYSGGTAGKRCFQRHGQSPNNQTCSGTSDTSPKPCDHCPPSNTKYCTAGSPCIAGSTYHSSASNADHTKCYGLAGKQTRYEEVVSIYYYS